MGSRVAAIAMLLFVSACGSGQWTRAERREVDAFTESIRHAQDVTSLSNAQMQGKMTGADLAPLETAAQQALDASGRVSDGVLVRLHPELPERYHGLFVPALKARLESVRAARAGQGSLADQTQWQFHMTEWGNWYQAHVVELRQKLQ